MGHKIVEHNGKWAVFSSIVDEFITEFTDKETLEQWRREEYGRAYYKPIGPRDMKTIEEAVEDIRLNRHNTEACIKLLSKAGVSEEESTQFIHKFEDEHYVPQWNGGMFVCPNCGTKVEEGQHHCDEEHCWLPFVWRGAIKW